MDKKILIVDDSKVMRSMIKNIFNSLGYEDIFEAGDGITAFKVFDSEKPDLVLMDLIMPNISGLDTLKVIKKVYPSSKIIICSSMGQEGIITEAMKLGAEDFIIKPFKKENLINIIKKTGI